MLQDGCKNEGYTETAAGTRFFSLKYWRSSPINAREANPLSQRHPVPVSLLGSRLCLPNKSTQDFTLCFSPIIAHILQLCGLLPDTDFVRHWGSNCG